MKTASLLILILLGMPCTLQAEDLGNLSDNRFDPDSIANPFATDAPRLYDQQGNYRGNLSANPYDPDSTGNPYGRYGSIFSP